MSSGFQMSQSIRECACEGVAEWKARPTAVRPESCADEAHGVETFVVEECGQWAVDIVVIFADGVVRKRIASHRTRSRAEIAASLIKRAAERGGRQLRFS